jgi:CheY-like chemotaxis protein
MSVASAQLEALRRATLRDLFPADTSDAFEIAVIDYHMPIMNGCLLADRLKSMRPEMKIFLHSGAVVVPESEMTSIDVFVPKSDGIARLIAWVSEHRIVTSER